MKKLQIICIGLFLMTAGSFAAFAQSPTTQTTQTAKTAKQDQFLKEAAQGGMTEIELSQLALQKSQNEEIKKYAQMMIDDHMKAGDELKTLAQDKNVTLPTEINAKQMAVKGKLSGLSGEAFDRGYIQTMVKDHDKTVKMFQTEADKGKDEEVKAFAAKTLPTLQMHLKEARDLNGSMMAKKSAE